MSDRTLYIDCFSGVAGNMFVAALLDLGAGSVEELETELAKLGLDGWSLVCERVRKAGISASRFDVEVAAGQPARDLAAIRELIDRSGLATEIRKASLAIFERLAAAEAAAHGETVASVHFHEVGMVDSIIDVVGAVVLMERLAPAEVICSPVALGSGMVDTMHGPMPVPAPATVNLLAGVPVREGEGGQELTTPTGAALVAHFAGSFGPLPELTLEKAGYGAGSRETARPNLLRMMTGSRNIRPEGELEEQLMLETNIDDSTPEQLAWLTEKLLAAGAADVWMAPVVMKKGRLATQLTVLCPPDSSDRLMELIFRESSTFGVRVSRLERHCLKRRFESVKTAWGEVRVKVGSWQGSDVTRSPEYEDCRRLAEQHGVPLKAVYEAAKAAPGR